MQSSDQEALKAFQKDYESAKDGQEDDINPFDDFKQQEPPKRKPSKRHKQKKNKKKKNIQRNDYQDEDNYQYQGNEFDDFVEGQAQEGDQEEDEDLNDAQFEGGIEERQRFQKLYSKKPRATDAYMERLMGKDDQQINKLYDRKALMSRQTEDLLPNDLDHKMFVVQVKPGKECEMVMCILNKTRHYAKTNDLKYKMEITSALSLHKKFPGKIFVEAQSQKAIRDSLSGFINVNVSKITPLDNQSYSSIFINKEDSTVKFKPGNFIRIKKGLYENDLGKIERISKNRVRVALAPRINMQNISIVMKEQISKLSDPEQIAKKKEEIFKKYTNHHIYYPPSKRPAKRLLNDESFKDYSDIPGTQRIDITPQGLIILSFKIDQITKLKGQILPIELEFFSANGKSVDQLQSERKHLQSTINFVQGDQAEVIAGDLIGLFGTVLQIKENTAIFKCRNKGMQGKNIQEPLSHLSKRFKERQRVRVISGIDQGKTGIILKLEDRIAEIWTDNQNSLKANKNNLEIYLGEAISESNIHGLKKDDLIKTTRNNVGIVIGASKDSIKILDLNNTIQIINNLDFDSKIITLNNLTKNKSGQTIRKDSIVRIKSGIYQGKKLLVKHVYKDFLFGFNEGIQKTNGITVQKSQNCIVISKTTEKPFATKVAPKAGNNDLSNNQTDEDLKVGNSIVVSTGPLKGYRGIIKSINKDKIEVRIPQKGCTQMIERDKISAKENSIDIGKTPKRPQSMTNMYAQSPMNF